MPQTSTAVVKQDEVSWIGWIEEIPGVNCQEASREAVLESLRVTLAQAIEFNRAEARDVAGSAIESSPSGHETAAICSASSGRTVASFFARVAVILGGITPPHPSAARCRATTKSTIISRARFVVTSAYPSPPGSENVKLF